MGEMKRITAKEAREITNKSNFLLKSVYKWIEDAAKRNTNIVYICSSESHEYDEAILSSVLDTLRTDGYTIENDFENSYWTVQW